MSMPEAAVHEDDGLGGVDDDVRRTRQRSHMQSVFDAMLSKDGPNDLLRRRVATLDPGHQFGSLRLGKSIRHVGQPA